MKKFQAFQPFKFHFQKSCGLWNCSVANLQYSERVVQYCDGYVCTINLQNSLHFGTCVKIWPLNRVGISRPWTDMYSNLSIQKYQANIPKKLLSCPKHVRTFAAVLWLSTDESAETWSCAWWRKPFSPVQWNCGNVLGVFFNLDSRVSAYFVEWYFP